MQLLDDFLPRLSPYVPGCPQPMALQALRDACIDFCDRTNILRDLEMAVPLQAGVATYDLDLPPEHDLARVVSAWIGERPLRVTARQHLTYGMAFDAGSSSGDPRLLYFTERGAATLTPTPSPEAAGQILRVQTAVKPSRTANSVNRDLFTDWVDAVVGGALTRLCVVPGQPFTSLEMATVGRGMFVEGLGRAKASIAKGKTVSESRVVARSFAGGRR